MTHTYIKLKCINSTAHLLDLFLRTDQVLQIQSATAADHAGISAEMNACITTPSGMYAVRENPALILAKLKGAREWSPTDAEEEEED